MWYRPTPEPRPATFVTYALTEPEQLIIRGYLAMTHHKPRGESRRRLRQELSRRQPALRGLHEPDLPAVHEDLREGAGQRDDVLLLQSVLRVDPCEGGDVLQHVDDDEVLRGGGRDLPRGVREALEHRGGGG